MSSATSLFRKSFVVLLCTVHSLWVSAQVIDPNLDPTAQQQNLFNQGLDSNRLETTEDWDNTSPRIYYTTFTSELHQLPDTSLSHFHRYRPRQPWWIKDLGNAGTAARNQFFDPALPIGLSLGYHIYDPYRLELEDLEFFNTTRPYSSFSGMIGAKAAQDVSVMHTQNINPDWNFAGNILYNSSPGFFAMQQAAQTGGSFSTQYKSQDQRYGLQLGFVYNRFRQQENGGITADSMLQENGDRMLIPVQLPATIPGGLQAATTNSLRDLDLMLSHHYAWGLRDTLYNEDSTSISYRFTPRFGLKHVLHLHSERHTYKDLAPDSLRYDFLAAVNFGGRDSVFSVQNWMYVDNRFSLNGFLGKADALAAVEAGLGIRADRFVSDFGFGDQDREASLSNYVFGDIRKEAVKEKQWNYGATARFFFSGPAIGNFEIGGHMGKDLGKLGQLDISLSQRLSNAPYAWNHQKTRYYERHYDFGKTSSTTLAGRYYLPKYKLEITAKNILLTNYLYYNSNIEPVQFSSAFSVLQLSARKAFTWKVLTLDNELAWQQATPNAPVHLPALLLRHQLRAETYIFKKALLIAGGIEARYHTPYYSDGYTPYFNQFYLQDEQRISSLPECSVFLNFKVKRFRAYLLTEQVQQLISPNIMNAPGYPAENFMFKFGFTWILIN